MRRWSTEIPMVGANLAGMPASCMVPCCGHIYAWRHGKQTPSVKAPDPPDPFHFLTFSSSRVNPLPRRDLVLYLMVWPRTTGLRLPATGLGKTFFALSARAAGIERRSHQLDDRAQLDDPITSDTQGHEVLLTERTCPPSQLASRLVEPCLHMELPLLQIPR